MHHKANKSRFKIDSNIGPTLTLASMSLSCFTLRLLSHLVVYLVRTRVQQCSHCIFFGTVCLRHKWQLSLSHF